MSSLIKKILFSLMIVLIAMLSAITHVKAAATVTFPRGYDDLKTSNTYYCMEHQDWFSPGTWQAVSSQTIRSDDPDRDNRTLAKILYDGIVTGQGGYHQEHGGPYQYAIWKWCYKKGINTTPVNSAIYDQAYAAVANATPYSQSGKAAISLVENKMVMNGMVGSIKVKSLTGSINGITITFKDIASNDSSKNQNKTIDANSSSIPGWVELYKDKDCTQPIKAGEIKKNDTVYFKNLQPNYWIKKVNISVKSKSSGYTVTWTRWKKTTGQATEQDLMSATKTDGVDTTASVSISTDYSYGSIKINKIGVYKQDGKDVENKNITATFKLYCTTLNKWVAGTAKGRKTYVDSIDKASEYTSTTTIKALHSTYQYQLVEVKVNDQYYNNPIKMISATSNLQKDLKVVEKEKYYATSEVEVYASKENIVVVKDEKTSGDLKIVKIDKHTEKPLQGVSIKVYSNEKEAWVVKDSNGKYSYSKDAKNVEPFITDQNGEIKLDGMSLGTYKVYETAPAEDYDLTIQEGYMKDDISKANGWVYLGDVDMATNTQANVYTFKVVNEKNINIQGRVWLDVITTKAEPYNYIYDAEQDELLSGIKVRLWSLNNNEKPIAETETKDGFYEFKDVSYVDAENAYVEFVYDNKTYIVVDTLVGENNTINSKAKEHTMTINNLKDENLTGNGSAVTEKKQNNLMAYLKYDENEKKYVAKDINLGLMPKETPSMFVSEELEYIKVELNGFEYTYKYGDPQVTVDPYAPKASRIDKRAPISPTDIAYSINQDKDNKLKVYVVYSIKVANTEAMAIDDIYQEKKLYLSELTNTFDDRYELSKDKIGRTDYENSQFNLWDNNKENANMANYNLADSENNAFKDGIEHNKPITSYIQFKVKDAEVEKLLSSKESIEEKATKAEAKGYHEYLRTDNVWVDDEKVTAFDGVKGKYEEKNSNNEKYYVHKSVECEDKSSDLYIQLTLQKSRTISGTVFEDAIADSSKNLGNGKLDADENKAKDVKVELVSKKDAIEPVKLYQYNENTGKTTTINAVVESNNDGTYVFNGVVPGYYYIRFTYGDGTQKMVVAGAEKEIFAKDYKSTIITGPVAEADKAGNNFEWYRKLGNEGYSTAVDDLNARKALDGYDFREDGAYDKNGNLVEKYGEVNIPAYTPLFGIKIENTEGIESADNYIYSEEKSTQKFEGFNFGLIKQPDIPVDITKTITNVKFTNQVGTTLVSENPVDSKSNLLTALEKLEGGSTYAKLELEPDAIYGSSVEITYEITIENNSEDYTDESYYKYGEVTEGNKKKLEIKEVRDDLDEKIDYKSIKFTNSSSNTTEPSYRVESDDTTKTTYVTISGWDSIASGERTTISYTATALLANDDVDSAYENKAKIKTISLDALSSLNSESSTIWKKEGKATITIAPNTGENRSTTYYIIGAVALVVLAGGIILIKKKVM